MTLFSCAFRARVCYTIKVLRPSSRKGRKVRRCQSSLFRRALRQAQDFLVLTGENAAHARGACASKPARRVTVCDANGHGLSRASISDVCAGADQSGRAEQRAPSRAEPARFLQRLYGVCQGGQAGACRSRRRRSLARVRSWRSRRAGAWRGWMKRSLAKKLERWQKIAASAAEQSGQRKNSAGADAVRSFREAVLERGGARTGAVSL